MTEETGKKNIESEWISNIRNGDKKSLEKLFFTYYAKLHRFALRYLHDSMAADDIIQDLIVKIWEDRETLSINYSLSAYLYSAVRNRAINHIRNTKARAIWEESDLSILTDNNPGPEEMMNKNEFNETVKKAIETLPGKCRLIFTMHIQDELKYAEIAKILEISENTISVQMGRALKKIRDILSRQQ